MNVRTKREYQTKVAELTGQLEAARNAAKALDDAFEAGELGVVNDQLGDAWNAIHTAIDALKYELREVDLEGYGAAARRRLEARSSALGQLVAQNID